MKNLTQYITYPLEIRKIIYTTNTIENRNRGIRKYNKAKVQYVDENAEQKAVYLAILNIEQEWNMPIQNWGMIIHLKIADKYIAPGSKRTGMLLIYN